MVIEDFKTKAIIEVNTPKELKEVLKYCNPMMMKHYKNQLPTLEIKGFGNGIEIKRLVITNKEEVNEH